MNRTWEPRFLESRSTITVGGEPYLWREARTSPDASVHWAHHGVVADFESAAFTLASPTGRSLVHLIGESMVETPDIGTAECHGMSLDTYGAETSLWIADNGRKAERSATGQYENGHQHEGQVVRVSYGGKRLQTITDAGFPSEAKDWRPTGVTNEPSGAGRVFVADGYGRDLVHCFDRAGNLLWTTDGEASGTPFNCPHGIIFDTRGGRADLLVADRGNRRVVVLTPEGEYIRTFGQEHLTSPSGFAIAGEQLIVSELYGALAGFDGRNDLIWRLGKGRSPAGQQWPNALVGASTTRPLLSTGILRSPHGVAVNRLGVIAITEWLIGGRLVLLTPSAVREA